MYASLIVGDVRGGPSEPTITRKITFVRNKNTKLKREEEEDDEDSKLKKAPNINIVSR